MTKHTEQQKKHLKMEHHHTFSDIGRAMRVFLVSVLLWLWIMRAEGQSIKTNINSKTDIKKEIVDTLDHQKIITQNINLIFEKYGKEKGLEIIRNHFLIEINTIRKKNNLPWYTANDTLERVAQEYAIYLEKNKMLSHVNKNGKRIWDRLRAKKYTFTRCGENLWDWEENIKEMIDIWMESQTHRAVILEKNNPTKEHFTKLWLWYCNEIWVMNVSD